MNNSLNFKRHAKLKVCSRVLYLNKLIISNIMFHASMGRFQLELIYCFTNYSTVVPSNICVFLSCRSLVVNKTFSSGLVGVEFPSVSWLGQLTVGV